MTDQSNSSCRTGLSDADRADLLAESSPHDQNTNDSEDSSPDEQNGHDSEMMVDETEQPLPGPAVVQVSQAYMDMVDRTLAMVPQGALALHVAVFIDMIDRASAVMDRSLPVLSAGDSSPAPEPDPTEGIAPQDSQTTALVVHSQGTIIVDPSQTPWELPEHIVTAITSDETPIEDIRSILAGQHGIHIDRAVMVKIVRVIRSLLESALFSNRPELPTNGMVLSIEAVQNLPGAWQQVFEHFSQLLPNSQGNGSLTGAWAIVDTAVEEYIRTSMASIDAVAHSARAPSLNNAQAQAR